ncbi:MAG: GTPase ObgE [Clostridia bacterium]|nr:GTPase ObgE [Clostridia bacterium]MDY5264642.1 GTPase ObgE [Eubacteriales bacterium]
MFLDVAKIYIKAGNGGDGATSFHREKFVPNGGPDGGDGGNGGSIIFVADKNMTTLIDFKYKVHYRAGNGENGKKKNQCGKSAEDLIIKVPCGTLLKDIETDQIIADFFEDGVEKVVLQGGRGGKGNARFATSQRKAPSFSQKGETTIEYHVKLELKTIADVGLVGFPNVGKSTLLSVLTSAKPKIANYHFTTLSPNLGVVNMYDDSFVIADIPGLIEGASEGAGLGHDFLRHIERVRLIVHVVDISECEGRSALEDYEKINNEITSYSSKLGELPQIVVLNKIDMLYGEENKIEEFANTIGKKVFPISAITHDGTKELLDEIYSALKTLPKQEPFETDYYEFEKPDENRYEIIKIDDDTYEITGGFIDKLARNVVLDDVDSFNYFQRVLRDKGIIKELYKKGAKEGDTVYVSDIAFDLID